MPPWGADMRETLPMRNDISLSEAADQDHRRRGWTAGAPKGNAADMPPPPTFTTGWTYGNEPDYILEMPVEFDIPAEGELGVQMFYSKVPFTEDRFAEVVELRPGNRERGAPRRHLLRGYSRRLDVEGRPHCRTGRQGDRRPRF